MQSLINPSFNRASEISVPLDHHWKGSLLPMPDPVVDPNKKAHRVERIKMCRVD